MNKLRMYGTIIVLCLFAMLMFKPMSVQAKTLKSGKTYTQYDVTGDKKKDKFKITLDKKDKDGWNHRINLFINGRRYKLKSGGILDAEATIVKLKNGNIYINVIDASGTAGSFQINSLYQYKKGKLVKVLDLTVNKQKCLNLANRLILKVSGNTLVVEEDEVNTALGVGIYIFNYNYKNGKFVKENIGKIKNIGFEDHDGCRGTMRRTKTLYTSPNFKKALGKIKAGEKADAIRIYLTKNKISIKLKTKDGRTGWVKCNNKQEVSKYIFKGCYYENVA